MFRQVPQIEEAQRVLMIITMLKKQIRINKALTEHFGEVLVDKFCS